MTGGACGSSKALSLPLTLISDKVEEENEGELGNHLTWKMAVKIHVGTIMSINIYKNYSTIFFS